MATSKDSKTPPVDRIRKLLGPLDPDAPWGNKVIAPGIRGHVSSLWSIAGDRMTLISEGVAEPGWFASGLDRTRRGFLVRKKEFEIDGRAVVTQTFKGTSRVEVRVRGTDTERADYQMRRDAGKEKRDSRVRKEALENYRAQRDAERAAERAAMSAEQKLLDAISDRITGCSLLCTEASMAISAKMKDNPAELEGSSKLGRAVDDLDMARRALGSIIRDVCRITGESADA